MNFSLNISTTESCETQRVINDLNEYFKCYNYFASKYLAKCIFQIALFVTTIILNFIVITLMISKKHKLSVFDQILLGHSIVDGLTALIDMPIYHIYDLFRYFPFDGVLSLLWTIYDNSINMTTSLHMMYASYTKYRCVKSPRGYKTEILMRHPPLTMLFIWILGFCVWTPVTIGLLFK